jgi:hypothetical protein
MRQKTERQQGAAVYQRVAEDWFEHTDRVCTVENTLAIVQIQYEVTYTCD